MSAMLCLVALLSLPLARSVRMDKVGFEETSGHFEADSGNASAASSQEGKWFHTIAIPLVKPGPPPGQRRRPEKPVGPVRQQRFSVTKELRPSYHGTNWRAWDLRDQQAVALKVFNLPWGLTDLKKESLEECRVVLGMMRQESDYPEGSAKICRCLEAHIDEADVPFLVMELCGSSLMEKLEEQWEEADSEFPSNVRKWMKDALQAIRFMSGLETPMVHSDLSLETIVVTPKNEAKIKDFGLAKPYNVQATLLGIERTPPEHVSASGSVATYPKEKSWAYDVWSLGTIYIDLLCRRGPGDRPFSLKSMREAGLKKEGGVWTCPDGSHGRGTLDDWMVIRAALADYEERASPERLLELMEER